MICDLAEYYHIYNYREMPPILVASLVSGLRDESRTKMKISGRKFTTEIFLMASIVDRLTIISHQLSRDKKKPKFITDILLANEKKEDQIQTFDSIEEFEKARSQILKGE